jgi:hypothetical protein
MRWVAGEVVSNLATEQQEYLKCQANPVYFIYHYCKILDAVAGEWIPFHLWLEQRDTVNALQENRLVVILKARQLGLTWLCLAYALWRMIFHPIAVILLFSKRDTEAMHLLERLKDMYKLLPAWAQAKASEMDSAHVFKLSLGSQARAFPTTAGDTYTGTFALVDEADLVGNLNQLMRSVKPTIDGGGQMVLLSRSDKARPASEFKRTFRAARKGAIPWYPIFLPWYVHPNRDQVWYEEQRRDILARTGALDDLHEQYPATEDEALSAAEKGKRLAKQWLEQCFMESMPILDHPGPAIPELEVYTLPKPGHRYVIGADPAEGLAASDDSSFTVMDEQSMDEVAALAAKLEPAEFALAIDQVGRWYNDARVLVERNNHGHAVILWLAQNSPLRILDGLDNRPGWQTNVASKSTMYALVADCLRSGASRIRSLETYLQLASIESSTLRAPDGELDDRATSFCLAELATMAIDDQVVYDNTIRVNL